MKSKTLLLLCLISGFFTIPVTAQTLQKGNVLGMHTRTIALQPDVTMEKYLDFYINRYIPEYEKNFPGVKIYVIKGIRGDNENSMGLIFLIKSVEVRDKYWPQKDVNSELAQEASKKMQPVAEELRKLGTGTETGQADWIIL